MRPARATALAAAGAAVLAAGALGACGGGGESTSGDSEVTWAISSSWDSWNPNTSEGNNSYLNQVLTPGAASFGDFNPDGEFVYNDAVLAKAPELASEAPLTVTYTLNENAQWNDGEPIRAEDFTYIWYQMSGNAEYCDQEQCAPATTDWGANVASITGADGVVTVTYIDGYLNPEWQFAFPNLMPSHIIEANGFANWQSDPAVMGESAAWLSTTAPTWSAGPYTPTDAVAGDYVIYEPNENYQGSADPGLDRLTLRVVEGTDAIVTALRNGEIDGSWPSEFSQEALDELTGDDAIATEIYDGNVWLHIDTNTNNPFLADQVLRQAVFTAIDNEELISRAYPDTEVTGRTNHFFSEAGQYHEDFLSQTDPQQGSGDADAANAALAAAGYTTGETLTTPDGEAVTLTFRYGEGDATRTLIGEVVQAQLAEIGIEVSLSAIPDGQLGTVLSEADFDLVIFGWSGTPAFTTAPFQYFGSDSGSNFGSYQLAGLDEAIARVTSTTSLEEAAGFANDVEAMVMPAAFTLPLFDEPQSTIYNQNLLDGVTPNGNSQSGPLWDVQNWQPA